MKTLSDAAHQAAAWLQLFPGAGAWAVLLSEPQGALSVRLAHGLPQLAPLLEQGLAEVSARKRPWLVEDLSKLPGVEPPAGGSILFVPVFAEGTLAAVLVLGSEAAGGVTQADADRLSLLSRGYGELLLGLGPEVRQPVRPPVTSSLAPLLGVGVLVVCLLGWVTRPAPLPPAVVKSKPPQHGVLRRSTAPADAIVSGFLREVSQGERERAYDLLSLPLQARLSPKRFGEVWQAWVSRPDGRWQMSYRRPVLLEEGEKRSTVAVQPDPVLGSGAQVWKWFLLHDEKHGWRIDRQDGGPLNGL